MNLSSHMLERPPTITQLLWAGLKPPEVCLFVQIGSGLGLGIQHGARHPEDRRHHCFGPFIPKVAVVCDDAGINLHVPVWHIHAANSFNLPEIEFAVSSI